MLKITQQLKDHMVKTFALAANADEGAVRAAVAERIGTGELDLDTLKQLSTAPAAEAENRIKGLVAEEVGKQVAPLVEKLDKLIAGTPTPAAGTGEPSNAQKAYAAGLAGAGTDGAAANDNARIRVKAVVEQFDDTRTEATYAKSDKEHIVKAFGHRRVMTGTEGQGVRGLDMPSDRTKAIAGAWMKHLINKAFKSRGMAVPNKYRMTELDTKLVEYAAHECKFVGPVDFDTGSDDAQTWLIGQKAHNDLMVKTLLDDTISGGLEAVPIEFDDAAILTPLLTGEIFPYVTIRNVTRRRIEAFSISNPTIQWGTGDGTQIGLLDTANFIAALDTTIYPAHGAIEIGLDFEADSPVGIGEQLMTLYGEAFRQEMDDVLVTGNGTTQPLGFLNTSGVSAIVPSGGAGTAQTVTDYENLLFGVKKPYRKQAGDRAFFIGTETSYGRARGIAVGASDQRRVFGMDHESFTLLNKRYAINESLTNAQILFVCANRYRLYRRQGYEVRVVTEDKELALANKRLIIVRARFGGQMEQAAAMSEITAGLA